MDRVDVSEVVAVLRVNARDVELLRSAIREANEALEDWEFETRMGCTRDELRGLAAKLREVEISPALPPR
jgi:hypothetical protein